MKSQEDKSNSKWPPRTWQEGFILGKVAETLENLLKEWGDLAVSLKWSRCSMDNGIRNRGRNKN